LALKAFGDTIVSTMKQGRIAVILPFELAGARDSFPTITDILIAYFRNIQITAVTQES
jgi:hypothetical protein